MEDRYISNMTFRVVLLGIQEIIGKNGLKTLLNHTGLKKYKDELPPNDHEKNLCMASEVSIVDRGVADIFGKNGGAAILFQVGRMQAKWGLEENPDTVTAARQLFSGMPEFDTARTAVELAAGVVAAETESKAWGEADGADVLYHIDEATHCFNVKSDAPLCYVTSGFITGIVQWATGKNDWMGKEEKCMAQGAAYCTFRVKKVSE
jgi:predicted hydrocarbon binding protein